MTRYLLTIALYTAILSEAFVLSLPSLETSKQKHENEVAVAGRVALDNVPLIDGHNDLPYRLLTLLNNQIKHFDFSSNLRTDPIFGQCDSCHTDLSRLKKGKVGAQFWVAYIDCDTEESKDTYVSRTLDQIDVIKRLINKYPGDLKYVTTADGILESFKENKIASLIGLEGGHSIENKLSVLRLYYELGVRYLTLTHTCNLPWADSATVDVDKKPIKNLTDFGKKIILEMNRLGMMVDLSHVSKNVMLQAIKISKAPVIFSHSSAKAVYSHVRNVGDDVLKKVPKTFSLELRSGLRGSQSVTLTLLPSTQCLTYNKGKPKTFSLELRSGLRGSQSVTLTLLPSTQCLTYNKGKPKTFSLELRSGLRGSQSVTLTLLPSTQCLTYDKHNNGIVMVNFYSRFIGGNASILDVAAHIDHIVDVAGIDHVGIGSDFDGVSSTPRGLEDVSKYPELFDLLRIQDPDRWTIKNLEKLAGRNFIRVFKEVEKVKAQLVLEEPYEETLKVEK